MSNNGHNDNDNNDNDDNDNDNDEDDDDKLNFSFVFLCFSFGVLWSLLWSFWENCTWALEPLGKAFLRLFGHGELKTLTSTRCSLGTCSRHSADRAKIESVSIR